MNKAKEWARDVVAGFSHAKRPLVTPDWIEWAERVATNPRRHARGATFIALCGILGMAVFAAAFVAMDRGYAPTGTDRHALMFIVVAAAVLMLFAFLGLVYLVFAVLVATRLLNQKMLADEDRAIEIAAELGRDEGRIKACEPPPESTYPRSTVVRLRVMVACLIGVCVAAVFVSSHGSMFTTADEFSAPTTALARDGLQIGNAHAPAGFICVAPQARSLGQDVRDGKPAIALERIDFADTDAVRCRQLSDTAAAKSLRMLSGASPR